MSSPSTHRPRLSGTALTLLLLSLCATGRLPALAADPAPSTARDAVHIVLVGDSTVTDKAGWGEAFAKLLRPEIRCTNTAGGGQSTKSFLDGGYWAKAIALRPTHVLIQFGHNDMPGKGPKRETDPETTYRANLIRFVDEARAAGAQPILVTSIPRRLFNKEKLRGELAPYAAATRKVAAEKKVPLADLYQRGSEAFEKLGSQKTAEFGPYKDGKLDATHLSPAGMKFTADQLADELRKVAPEFAAFLRPPEDR